MELSGTKKITEEFLQEKVTQLVQFSLHDKYNCKFRKLLTTHQFSDSKIADLYTERYVNNLLNYHKKLFEVLIKKGVLISGDVDSMAMQYVTPVYTLIGICDRNPDNESECMEKLKRYELFPLSEAGKGMTTFSDIMHVYVITAAVVVTSIASLSIIIAGGMIKDGCKSLAIWATAALSMMFIGAIGTGIVPEAYFGIVERFSVFSAIGFNAVLGIYLVRGFELRRRTAQNE